MAGHEDYAAGVRAGIRWSVTRLHHRAEQMNDPHAKGLLNGAGFWLGNELTKIKEGHAFPDPTKEGADE